MNMGKGIPGLVTSGLTPLHYAVLNDTLGVGKSLVSHGASVDMQASDGATPMIIAQETAAGSLTFTRIMISRIVNIVRIVRIAQIYHLAINQSHRQESFPEIPYSPFHFEENKRHLLPHHPL